MRREAMVPQQRALAGCEANTRSEEHRDVNVRVRGTGCRGDMVLAEDHHLDELGGLRGALRMHTLPLAIWQWMCCCIAERNTHVLPRHALWRDQQSAVDRACPEGVWRGHQIHRPVRIAVLVVRCGGCARRLEVRLAPEALRQRLRDGEGRGGVGRNRGHGRHN